MKTPSCVVCMSCFLRELLREMGEDGGRTWADVLRGSYRDADRKMSRD